MTKHPYYLVYIYEYQDPTDMIGPFETREAALLYHFNSLQDAGADFEEDADTPESVYLDDDGVRLTQLVGTPK